MIERILVVVFVALTLSTAQAADDQGKFQASRKTWQELKQKCGGNYSYKIRWSSWVGFGHETEIFVRNNKVVKRRFSAFSKSEKLEIPTFQYCKAICRTLRDQLPGCRVSVTMQ